MNRNPKSLVVLSIILVAGVLGAVAAYRAFVPASADSAERETLVVGSDNTAKQQAKDGRRAGFAPCRKPARLEGRKCVTEEVRTVTVPGTSAVASAPRPAPAPAAPPAPAVFGGDDHGHHHGGDDDGHHHGGDDDGHHHSGEGEDGHHHGGDDDRDDDDHDDHDDRDDDDHDDDHDDDDHDDRDDDDHDDD
jgi:hypothetical protein